MKPTEFKSFQVKVITNLLQILNLVKLYHWKTSSYSTHKATDELYSKLNENIDEYIEVMLGKMNTKFDLKDISTLKIKNIDNNKVLEKEIKQFILDFYKINNKLDSKHDTDLLNLRDEIIASLNQFLYLLRLN